MRIGRFVLSRSRCKGSRLVRFSTTQLFVYFAFHFCCKCKQMKCSTYHMLHEAGPRALPSVVRSFGRFCLGRRFCLVKAVAESTIMTIEILSTIGNVATSSTSTLNKSIGHPGPEIAYCIIGIFVYTGILILVFYNLVCTHINWLLTFASQLVAGIALLLRLLLLLPLYAISD